MPNLPVPDIPAGTTETNDTLLGVKSDESLVLLPYAADQATQDAAIAATEVVADGAVQRAGDVMTGNLDVPSLVVDGGPLVAGGTFQAIGTATVPDGTADGEALAYGQDDAVLGSTTMTGGSSGGDTVGVTVRNTNGSVPVDMGAGRFQATAAGTIQVRRENDSGVTSGQPLAWTFDSASNLDLSPDGTVTVPDGTADGQALAHSQSGAELDGLTSTAGILIESGTGSSVPSANAIEVRNINAASGSQRFKLSVTNSGSPRLDVMSDDGTTATKIVFVARTDGELRLTDNTSVTVPDGTADGQALAHSQSGAVLADLDINAAGPAVLNLTDTTSNPGRKIFRVRNTGNWTYTEIVDDDGTTVLFRPLSFRYDGEVTMAGASSVLVPDATADGEALAHSQSGAVLNGLTSTENVEVESSAPKLTLSESDQAADARAWKLQASAGTFKISSASDVGSQQTAFINIDRATGALALTEATSVTVPDGTADGQALAHSQSGAELAGLDINAAGNAIIKMENVSSGNPDARTVWLDQAGQSFYIRSVDSLGGINRNFFVANNAAGTVSMAGATSVTVPAAADGDTTTAAQTTAKDSTTGQVQVNGVEVGDTGWRDVSSLLLNGWTGTLEWRRIGYQIFLRTFYAGLDGSAATDDIFLAPNALGSGCYYDTAFDSALRTLYYRPNGAVITTGYTTTGAMYAPGSGAVADKYTFFDNQNVWMVSDSQAWPSSLPGTAA